MLRIKFDFDLLLNALQNVSICAVVFEGDTKPVDKDLEILKFPEK